MWHGSAACENILNVVDGRRYNLAGACWLTNDSRNRTLIETLQQHQTLIWNTCHFLSTVLSKNGYLTNISLYRTTRSKHKTIECDDTIFRTRLNPLFLQPPYICGFIFPCAFIKMQQTYFRQRLFHTKHMTNNNTFNFPSLMAAYVSTASTILFTPFYFVSSPPTFTQTFPPTQNITTQYCYTSTFH